MEYTKMAKQHDKLGELAQELVKEYKTEDALFGKKGVLKEPQRHLYNAALQGELTDHLGFDEYERTETLKENARNGYSKKRVKGSAGEFEIDVPRDREGSYAPRIIAKRQTRIEEFDEKILWLYSRGSSTTEIQAELREL